MPGIAVIKPDHLGDLVLASPAIRALGRIGDVVLYVASSSLSLARFLFADLDIRPVDFPHLARKPVPALNSEKLIADFGSFERVIILRDDTVMRDIATALGPKVLLASGDHLTHETRIHQRALRAELSPYSRTRLFATQPIFWPASVRSVGLCIAAGFPTNSWPLYHWYELAILLDRHGFSFKLIGGPNERDSLSVLSAMLASIEHEVIQGGPNINDFFNGIHDLDLVVASDGGSAHICSISKPILSIFGSSPWRRYAPFGFANVLLTRDLVCSPCLQFSTTEVNGCLTRECMINVTPKDVFRSIVSNGIDFAAVRQAKAYRGVSHLST